jgi:hypothetical protein
MRSRCRPCRRADAERPAGGLMQSEALAGSPAQPGVAGLLVGRHKGRLW